MKPLLAALALVAALTSCSGNQSGESNPDNIGDRVPLPTETAAPS